MAKQTAGVAQKPGIMTQINRFIQEVKVEMQKVAWPSKNELKSHTSVVMVMLFVMAGVIYVYDFVALHLVKLLLYLG